MATAPVGRLTAAGIVLWRAVPVSSAPVPQKPCEHVDPAANSADVPCRIDRTRPAVRLGLRASISDTVPDTSGAEKLVPIAKS
jgi:hypothetical protein